MLRKDVKSQLFSIGMLISLLLGLVLLVEPQYQYFLYFARWDNKADYINFFFSSLALGGYLIFTPIITVMPGVFRFCDEYNSGYLRFMLVRSKSFFKWWIKTVSSALLWCVLYCLIGIAVCAAAAEKVGTLSAFELMRIAAYPLALGASMCALCLLRFLLGQKPAAAIVIAVVGTTGLICGKLKSFSFAMLGAYGMAKQLTDAKTAAAVLFADATVIILAFLCSGAVKRRALKGGHYFD